MCGIIPSILYDIIIKGSAPFFGARNILARTKSRGHQTMRRCKYAHLKGSYEAVLIYSMTLGEDGIAAISEV